MALGNQPTAAQIDQEFSQWAEQTRDFFDGLQKFVNDVNAVGAAGLQAAGKSSADAATAITNMGYFANLTGLYYGTLTQPSAFNFDNALAPLRDLQ